LVAPDTFGLTGKNVPGTTGLSLFYSLSILFFPIIHMKAKIIFTLLTISALSISCDQSSPSEQTILKAQFQEEIHDIEHHNIEILEIDECQYIIYKEKDGTNLAYGYMAHKGNCNNPVHKESLLLTGQFADTEE